MKSFPDHQIRCSKCGEKTKLIKDEVFGKTSFNGMLLPFVFIRTQTECCRIDFINTNIKKQIYAYNS